MTPTSAPTSARRTATSAAIGAVALAAAVALPAFAIDHGGDGSVDAATAAAPVESTTTTTTTVDPGLVAWLEAKAVNDSLAALATLTPAQQFALLSKDWTAEQQAAFAQMAADNAQLESFYAWVAWTTAVAESNKPAPVARVTTSRAELRGRQRLGPARAVRGRWQLVAPDRVGRLLRRPDVPLRHLERHGWPGLRVDRRRRDPRTADRHRRARPRPVGLGRLARLLAQARPALSAAG